MTPSASSQRRAGLPGSAGGSSAHPIRITLADFCPWSGRCHLSIAGPTMTGAPNVFPATPSRDLIQLRWSDQSTPDRHDPPGIPGGTLDLLPLVTPRKDPP